MIEEHMSYGADKPKTREQLSRETGCTDREVRQAILAARNRGVPIVSTSGGSGYYIAKTEIEKMIIVGELRSRSRCMAMTADAIERTPI